ncbi:MAG: CopD family protein [Pseudomonadota bacterium]
MLWLKTFHIVAMVAWFAGLFYLPRLYVYHAEATDTISIERFKIMERRLFWGIMTPMAVLTVFFGLWLMIGYGFRGGWLHAKISCVLLLLAHHVYLGRLMLAFRADKNTHSPLFYRWINEIPTLPLLIAIVALVVQKPF